MYETLLVPTDGSPVAKAAGEYACALARQFDADVYILSVEDPLESDEEGGERAVTEIADLASEAGLEVTTEVIETEAGPHETIIDYAGECDADCIVMGTHGRTGMDRFILGSVAEQTLRESPVPVVTVHEETNVDPTIDRVLVATDGSDAASAAVSHAAEVAKTVDAQLDLLYVAGRGFRPESEEHELTAPTAETGYDEIDEAAERAFDAGIGTAHAAILSGRPDQVILAHAAERGADCVVVGTHGRTGLRRYLLGSTTERLVRFANVPVFAVKPERGPTATVEYLHYEALEAEGWSLEDDDLFSRAAEADLGEETYGTLEVEHDEYLLDAAESQGLEWPYYCRAGGCVNCAAVLEDGEVEMEVNRSLEEAEVEDGLRLTCVGTPASETIRLVVGAKELEELEDRVM